MSLPIMGEIAGVNLTSLGGCLHSLKTRARWSEGFHDELNGHVFDLKRDGLCQVVLCFWVTMRQISNHTMPNCSPLGPTKTTPSTIHQDEGIKHVADASLKSCWRDNITIRTWIQGHKELCGNSRNEQMKWTGTGETSLDSVKWDGRTLAKQQQKKETRFSSEEKRINTSMALVSWTLSWDVTQSPAGWSPSAWGQSLWTSQ